MVNESIGVAVIGTREPSSLGYKIAERLGYKFGEAGLNVVSGLAIGCDTGGHKGSLQAHGLTTAILAQGLDKVYPKENKELADSIIDNGGCLISEYFVGSVSQASNFVERDRLQAGLSHAVVVVETDIKGGTMHTVKYAEKYQRILACFDHKEKEINHPKSQGNRMLIKEKRAIPLSNDIEMQDLINLLKTHEPKSYIESTKPTSEVIEVEKKKEIMLTAKSKSTKGRNPKKVLKPTNEEQLPLF